MNQPTEPVTQQGGRLASRRRSGGARRDALLFVLPLALLLLVFVYAPMARLGYYAFTEYNGLRPPRVGRPGQLPVPDRLARLPARHLRTRWSWPAGSSSGSPCRSCSRSSSSAGAAPTSCGRSCSCRRCFPRSSWAARSGSCSRRTAPSTRRSHGIGLDALAQPWLSSETWVLPSLIAVIAWATMGTGVLLYSAGLSSLSRDYVEAAIVDGARWHQLVWSHLPPGARAGDPFLGAAADDRARSPRSSRGCWG